MGIKPLGPPKAAEKINVRPKPLRTTTRIPTGPKMYRKAAKPEFGSGPGEPPPGFVTPTTSKSEWLVYWAIWKALDVPGNVRQGPFNGPGTGEFEYQSWQMGGRSSLGGAVVDFLIFPYGSGSPIGVRVQTEYFHIFAGSNKIASDEIQLALLSRNMTVVDVFDYEFIHLNPEDLVIYFKRSLGLLRGSPIAAGTARRNRR